MTDVEFQRIHKLHELLAVGIEDGQRVLGDDRYRPYYGLFHRPQTPLEQAATPEEGPVCLVCLAGAVMAKTLGVPTDARMASFNFKHPIERRLDALDRLRVGDVGHALMLVNDGIRLSWEEQLRLRHEIANYSFDGEMEFEAFLGEMDELRQWLLRHDL